MTHNDPTFPSDRRRRLAALTVACLLAWTALPSTAGATEITLNNRVVELQGGVDLSMIKKAQSKLLAFDGQSDAPVWLRINSPGGSVDAGLILVDTLSAMRSPVKCIVESKAYSMAAIILVFCAERYALPHATIMLHEASYGTAGEDPTNRKRLDFLTRYLDRMHKEIAQAIRMPVKKYRARIRDAWWLMADEAQDVGIIDGIISRIQVQEVPVEKTERKDTVTEKSTRHTVPADAPKIPKRRP